MLDQFGIEADYVEARCGGDKFGAFQACLARFHVDREETWVFGDDASDYRAADLLQAWHLGNPWLCRSMTANTAPDVAWFDAEELLRQGDWYGLAYLGELAEAHRPIWHRGSLLPLGEDAWALGRYFKGGSPRHGEALSAAVLRGKNTTAIQPVVSDALSECLPRLAASTSVHCVVSVPPHEGKLDRFEAHREMAGDLLGARQDVDLCAIKPVPSGYKQLDRQHKRALREGRYWCGDDLQGLTVAALDDVTTTGSTLGAVSDALFDAGAERVLQLAFAVTQD